MAVVREITIGDEVKNINGNDIVGFVIAKYMIPEIIGITYIDVRTEDRIYYQTPIKNWQTVNAVEDLE